MTHVSQNGSSLLDPMPASYMPPASMQETAWDILLALYGNQRGAFGLHKLARMTSVPLPALYRWLALLEQRQLISGGADSLTGELHAVLTPAGRQLLDRYLSAASDLHVGACH